MAVTITWDDGVNQPAVYGVSNEVLACLEQYRQLVTIWNGSENVIKFESISSLVLGTLTENLVAAAMNQFPPASVVSAKAGMAQAIVDYQTALRAAITGGIA